MRPVPAGQGRPVCTQSEHVRTVSSVIYSPVVKTVGIFQEVLQYSDFSSSIEALGLVRLLLLFIFIVNTEPFLHGASRLGCFHLLQHNRLEHLQEIEIILGNFAVALALPGCRNLGE